MIYDQVSKREMYQALIDQLDVRPQQIEIEALIVDIDRSKLSELGVEWGVRSSGGHVVGQMNNTQADSQGVDLPLPGATLLISNAARFYARLKALEGNGEAHILATPTVLTLNNVAAVLDLSQTRYISLVGERVADLADISAGTMLRVIPRIVQDGTETRVRLEVDIEDGTLGDAAANANVTRSTISTQAIVELQQTLMIGGYRSESLSTRQQKVPVLGDIPLFGNLFRNETASQDTRERLFLITPRLQDSFGIAAAPASKAAEAARKLVALPAAPDAQAGTASHDNAATAGTAPSTDQTREAAPASATTFKVEAPSLFSAPVKRSKHKCGRCREQSDICCRL
jgi:type III secretion protein C